MLRTNNSSIAYKDLDVVVKQTTQAEYVANRASGNDPLLYGWSTKVAKPMYTNNSFIGSKNIYPAQQERMVFNGNHLKSGFVNSVPFMSTAGAQRFQTFF